MATILIVDDLSVNRQFLATLLKYTGHRIVEAADGMEALDVAKREKPDLAIVDILMPRMDGVEFVRQLRKTPTAADPEVVFYTATYRVVEARRLADSVGVEHVLQKPARPEEILETVCRLLADDSNPVMNVIRMADQQAAAPQVPAASVAAQAPAAASAPLLRAEYLNTRMSALVELTLEMGAVNDPQELLKMACDASRRILHSACCVGAILAGDENRLTHFAYDTAPDSSLALMPPENAIEGVFGDILRSQSPRRCSGDALPRPLSCVTQGTFDFFLGVPIRSSAQHRGWLLFLRQADHEAFTIEDERLAGTISAYLGTVFGNAQLAQHNENLLRFTSIVSHDIKGPLRGIGKLCDWVEEAASDVLGAEPRKHLAMMRARVDRVQQMVDDLQAYSGVGGRSHHPERVDVADLLQKVLFMMTSPEPFQIRIGDSMPVLMTWRIPLDLVFRNLIGNAYKHHDRRDGHIDITARETGRFIGFTVADDGPGIAPEYHERIFEEFATMASESSAANSGLGLTMVKRTIETYGGVIRVESDIGKGARFCFTWPRDPMPA